MHPLAIGTNHLYNVINNILPSVHQFPQDTHNNLQYPKTPVTPPPKKWWTLPKKSCTLPKINDKPPSIIPSYTLLSTHPWIRAAFHVNEFTKISTVNVILILQDHTSLHKTIQDMLIYNQSCILILSLNLIFQDSLNHRSREIIEFPQSCSNLSYHNITIALVN